MKITIVNCYRDDNKGSCAIAWGLIERVRQLDRNAEVSVISMEHDVQPERDHRHLIKRFGGLRVLPSPLHLGESDRGRLGVPSATIGRVRWASYAAAMAVLQQSAVWRRRLNENAALEAIRTSDLVIDRGGPFWAAGRSPINPSLLTFAWPLRFATTEGVPYGMVGESFGYFRSATSRRFASAVCKAASFLGVRDRFSLERVKELCPGGTGVAVMPDNAFWVQARTSERVRNLLRDHQLREGEFVVIVPRRWHPIEEARYHAELAELIRRLVSAGWSRVAVVANTYDPLGEVDERAAVEDVIRRADTLEAAGITEDLAPDELAALYGSAGAVVATRLHAVVLSLLAGAPTVAVAYDDVKTHGIMDYLGLPTAVMRLNDFQHADALRRLDEAMASQRGIRDLLSKRKADADAWFQRVVLEAVSQ